MLAILRLNAITILTSACQSWDGTFYAQLSPVPEPTTLGFLAASSLLALRRRQA